MGEMADFYINRQIERHMNPYRENQRREQQAYREKRQRMESLQAMNDQELMETAKEAIQTKRFNERFIMIGKNIVSDPPARLSEKQRNCLLGLLNV